MALDNELEEDLNARHILEDLPDCSEIGHQPTLVIADNGFTYVWVCGRCGKPTT